MSSSLTGTAALSKVATRGTGHYDSGTMEVATSPPRTTNRACVGSRPTDDSYDISRTKSRKCTYC